MKTIFLTPKQIQKLKTYPIGYDTICNEANFYKVLHHPKSLYKIYQNKNEKYLERKEQKVVLLGDHKEEIAIPELVLPDRTIYVNESFNGIRIDKVKGTNLSVILSSQKVPLTYKIELLKQLGSLLERIKKANPRLNLAFGDVHPDNFIIKNDKVYGIDTDSMRILDSSGRISYFLTSGLVCYINKYPLEKDGLPEASTDTDIFCFIMIIFQLLTNKKSIFRITLDEYKRYLDYLDTLGIDSKLLEAFASIYDLNNPNINPTPHLNKLIIDKRTSYQAFKSHL